MTTETEDTTRRWRRKADVAHRVIDDEAVLVDLRSGHYFGLNETGTAIWERLGGDGATLDDLAAAVTEAFDVTAEVARDDAAGLLDTLVERGLAESVADADPGA